MIARAAGASGGAGLVGGTQRGRMGGGTRKGRAGGRTN